MIVIPITNIPNQSLSIPLDDNNYEIRIHCCNDNFELGTSIMAVDIFKNDEAIVLGMRAQCGTPLLPFPYMQTDGNFIFVTSNDEYPNWRLFGVNQYLIYVSRTELQGIYDESV